MPFTLVVTQLGRANVLNPANTGTLAATITQAGVSASVITPVETATTLPGEIKRLAGVGGDVVADDTIHVSALDESADTYTANSVALYLGDGTLFAIGGGGDPLFNKAAGSMAALALDIVLTDIAATSVSFGATSFMEAPATTERQGIVELATVTEAQAGIDALRALTPASTKAAVLGWLLAQDGAGSGLDADLLDGQNGTWYADIAARLGYTPANRAGDTFGGTIARDSSFYFDISGGNAIINFAPNDYLFYERLSDVLRIVVSSGERFTLSAAGLWINGAKAWHAGNDGSGSGLDADLLDGQHASSFMAASGFTAGSNANGWWEKRPNGAGGTLISQRGIVATPSGEGTIGVTFPTPFTDAGTVVPVPCMIGAPGASYDMWAQVEQGSISTNGFTVRYQSTGGNTGLGFTWHAQGY